MGIKIPASAGLVGNAYDTPGSLYGLRESYCHLQGCQCFQVLSLCLLVALTIPLTKKSDKILASNLLSSESLGVEKGEGEERNHFLSAMCQALCEAFHGHHHRRQASPLSPPTGQVEPGAL